MTPQEHSNAEQKRLALNKEINSYPVIIDRRCFVKSNQEIQRIKDEKAEWKLDLPANYKPVLLLRV